MYPIVIQINLIIAGAMLLFTSYLDIKRREIPDKVWIVFGAIGAVLQVYEIQNGESSWFYLLIALVLATVIGMGIFFIGLYGGADGKALVILAMLVPYFTPRVGIYPIAPLIVLTNGVLLSMLLPLGLILLNIVRTVRGDDIFEGFSEPMYRKVLAAFLGYKSKSKPRDFQFSMQKNSSASSTEVQTKKFDFTMMQDDFETQPGTWVTPGIPLLVFFTAGYFILLLYGDLIISIISFFASLA